VENINKEFDVNYFVYNDSNSTDDFIDLMNLAINSPNSSMNTKCTTTEEIENKIMTLTLKNSSGNLN